MVLWNCQSETFCYVVLGTWVDKQTGEFRSNLAEVSKGVSKSGNRYQITQTDQTMQVDGEHDVGTILTFNLVPQAGSVAPATPAKPKL